MRAPPPTAGPSSASNTILSRAGPEIDEPYVGIACHAIGERAAPIGRAAELGEKFAHHGMVDAGDREPVIWNGLDELLEALMQRGQRLPIVHMLGIDVGDDADLGGEL